MTESRQERSDKKKKGQFLTPLSLAIEFIKQDKFTKDDVILEPSFGNGSFVFAIIDRYIELFEDDSQGFIKSVIENNIVGVELDEELYTEFFDKFNKRYGFYLEVHNFINADFFDVDISVYKINKVRGNPPFGGTFDRNKEDLLDRKYGKRNNQKIKKETYAFFTVKCLDEVKKQNGDLKFICSDSFITISTMKGLRDYMLSTGKISITSISDFSEETTWPMLYFHVDTSTNADHILVDNRKVELKYINMVPNRSWSINEDVEKYFSYRTFLSNYITCTSGMTVGNNELWIKKVVDGKIEEFYNYDIVEEPITLEKETSRVRHGNFSRNRLNEIENKISNNETELVVKITKRDDPIYIDINHSDYKPFNKSSKYYFYTEPQNYIYWRDNGNTHYKWRKQQSWYLHGVGGKPFFYREGFSWQLISSKIKPRYLPSGCVLDSGAPSGFLDDGIESDELYFIMGWCASETATRILKNIINHTKNIQGKDIERLPYPIWVSQEYKNNVIKKVKEYIDECIHNKNGLIEITDELNSLLNGFNNIAKFK